MRTICSTKAVTQSLIRAIGITLCFLLATSTPASADSHATKGLSLYQSRNYKAAAAEFEQATPRTANTLYYLGLCHYALGDVKKSNSYFTQTISMAPGTPVGNLAMAALQNKAFVAPKTAAASPQSTTAATTTKPAEAPSAYNDPGDIRVPFTLDHHDIMIDCQINNRKITMCLDTGAPDSWIGTNHLKELSIAPPTGPFKMMQSQLGENDEYRYWTGRYNLRINSFDRPNFEFLVQEDRKGPALIGQTFLSAFEYTIDYGAKQIHFKPKKPRAAAPLSASVHSSIPFTRETGSYMFLTGEINGKPCKMCFDTGADEFCMNSKDCTKYGVELNGKHTVARRIKIGPIDNYDVPVRIIDSDNMTHPLVGQSFYKNYQYTIDNDKMVINLIRR